MVFLFFGDMEGGNPACEGVANIPGGLFAPGFAAGYGINNAIFHAQNGCAARKTDKISIYCYIVSLYTIYCIPTIRETILLRIVKQAWNNNGSGTDIFTLTLMFFVSQRIRHGYT